MDLTIMLLDLIVIWCIFCGGCPSFSLHAWEYLPKNSPEIISLYALLSSLSSIFLDKFLMFFLLFECGWLNFYIYPSIPFKIGQHLPTSRLTWRVRRTNLLHVFLTWSSRVSWLYLTQINLLQYVTCPNGSSIHDNGPIDFMTQWPILRAHNGSLTLKKKSLSMKPCLKINNNKFIFLITLNS